MEKEYDIINELGYHNWMDGVAGEAVLLGYFTRNPELELMGTNLARLIKETPYYSERFARVEAEADHVLKEIKKVKDDKTRSIFIDTVYSGKESESRKGWNWEYSLFLVEGTYRIQMNLPNYAGEQILKEENKALAEAAVRNFYDDPSFKSYEKRYVETDYSTQVFKTTSFFDKSGQLLRRTIDHDHEGFNFRNWQETYYFLDFNQATSAWTALKEIVTSGQTK